MKFPSFKRLEFMKLNRGVVVKGVLPVFAGGLLGYAYYYFIGCYSGSCPIQSNPLISIAYGALVGGVFAFPGKKKEGKEPEKKNEGSVK